MCKWKEKKLKTYKSFDQNQNGYVATVGLAGNIGLEIITSMLKNTFSVCTAAIGHEIDEISALLEKPEPKPMKTIHHQFKNCMIQAQDLDMWVLYFHLTFFNQTTLN